MILTRVQPGPPQVLDCESRDARAQLLEWYRPPELDWLRLNLVASINGSAAGNDGTSNSITTAMHRRILGVIRELSDVVLVGAASVRSEGYQIPKHARLAVVTSTGDLDGHRIDPEAGDRLIVVCPTTVASIVRAQFPDAQILCPANTEAPHWMGAAEIVAVLRNNGFASIVCEGGPSLASQLVSAGLAHELCLTTSPLVTSARLPLFGTAHPPGSPNDHSLVLDQLLIDESSSLYARWSFTRQGAAVQPAMT
ncbi:MAG: dihydrofolate reductase family protein [Salinibacterium sp.]|nr:dihydrofolate reductase family protein [Salinibacterium sp.]